MKNYVYIVSFQGKDSDVTYELLTSSPHQNWIMLTYHIEFIRKMTQIFFNDFVSTNLTAVRRSQHRHVSNTVTIVL